MKRMLVVCALALFSLTATAANLSAASITRSGPLAYELVRASNRAYEAARTEGVGGSTREELMLVRLFEVWAGSRVLFDLVESPDTSRRRIEDTLALLQVMAMETDEYVQRSRGYAGVRTAWQDTKAALSLLLQEYGMSWGEALPSREGTGNRGPDEETTPEPEPAPLRFQARITATDWLGGFTPDLEVRGVFEGKGLSKARIEVQEDDGDVVWHNDELLTQQIRRATEGFGRNDEVRVDWRVRIDDDDLISGDNRIVVILTDLSGDSVTADIVVKKRLF